MNNQFDLTPVIELIIALTSALITTFLIPYLRQKLSCEKCENLKKWVSLAVEAAEQLYGSKTGQQKKEYVVSFLLSKGLVFDVEEVNAMIESEVYKLTKEMNA
ncbi:MAG: phage holin, LLH family [Acutalibacteraceae bacterium]|nr:phage holin, LLH family [Acutalibacteraceae bacterium]